MREIVKDWARATRPYVQRLRETLRACQAASHALTAAGRTERAGLGAGDFTRILDAISTQRQTDGTLYSASHRNLMIYQFCQVIEYGRASGLMATVPDPFRPATRHRVRDDPNEDELGKALPDPVIRQLDAHLRGTPPDVPFLLDARTVRAGDHFTFGTAMGALDMLGMPMGTKGFPDLDANASDEVVDGLTVRVASIEDLIRMKRAAGRPKDLIAVEWLSAVRDELAGPEPPEA